LALARNRQTSLKVHGGFPFSEAFPPDFFGFFVFTSGFFFLLTADETQRDFFPFQISVFPLFFLRGYFGGGESPHLESASSPLSTKRRNFYAGTLDLPHLLPCVDHNERGFSF